MASPDRFDLEQRIMACWQTADDINLLVPQLLDGDLDVDDIANLLIGIRELHNLRVQAVMNTFEQLIAEDKFADYEDEGEDD